MAQWASKRQATFLCCISHIGNLKSRNYFYMEYFINDCLILHIHMASISGVYILLINFLFLVKLFTFSRHSLKAFSLHEETRECVLF